MPHPRPDIAQLRRLLDYDPETGVITWCERTPDMFAGATEKARRKTCACWNGRFAGKPALIGIDPSGYFQGPVQHRYVKAHRVAWAMHYGVWPSHKINHRNGDHRDNRIANLRDVDHRTCHRNAKLSSRNKSGVAGVCWHKSKGLWLASIHDGGRSKALGAFASFADAVAARQAAERDLGFDPAHGKRRDFANHFVPARDRPGALGGARHLRSGE